MPSALIETGHRPDLSPFALCHLLAREMRLRKSGPRGLRLPRAIATSPSDQTDATALFASQPVPLGTAVPSSAAASLVHGDRQHRFRRSFPW